MPEPMQGIQVQVHKKGFWPLFIILVVAVIAGLLVYWFRFQLISDYDNQSVDIRIHKRTSKPAASKSMAK